MDVREKLVELFYDNNVRCDQKIEGLADDVMDIIAHGVTAQEWISVEKRLPEPGERVLATDGGFIGEFYVNRLGQWKRYNVNDHSLLMALDILWWMPMPQPPKGE